MQETRAAVYIKKEEGFYAIGLAVIESFGLRAWVCEIPSDPSHPYGAIDRVLHLLFVAGSKHLIIGGESIKDYEEIARNFDLFDYRYESRKFDSQVQNQLFQNIFSLHSLLTPLEHLSLETRPMSAQALALLASEIVQSSSYPLALPTILETNDLLELGNNPLEQLEMMRSDPKLPDIATLFLTMSTPMGKRLGRHNLFLPIKDIDELNRRYDRIEAVKAHTTWLEEQLREVGNIELEWWKLQNRDESGLETLLISMRVLIDIQRYLQTHHVSLILSLEIVLENWVNDLSYGYAQRQWLEEQIPTITRIIDWVSWLDVAVSSANIAQCYGLSRPAIVTADESFLQMIGVRHLLVEVQGIEYVPNDIVMGNRDHVDLPYPSTVMLDPRVHDGADIHGVLLYGINSSGKSSLMKSIGIAVVLAQAGFFVPAKAMKFTLFDGLYTRIQSRDNVAKSLSTFGVEMLELNSIFDKATPKTLVLGDEISHGTETLSAVAIVASTIIELCRKKSLFLLTTHLHQLSMVRELSLLREVVSLHLSVHYDESSDTLVYDRILRSGRGSSIYGLEFAESLHMNPNFLSNAKRLRENLAKEYDLLERNHKDKYLKAKSNSYLL